MCKMQISALNNHMWTYAVLVCVEKNRWISSLLSLSHLVLSLNMQLPTHKACALSN